MYGNPDMNDVSSWEWRSIKNHWVERYVLRNFWGLKMII